MTIEALSIPTTVNVDDVTINYNTDGKLQVKDSGLSVDKLAFGTWELIADITIQTNCTTYTLNGLDGDADKIYFIIVRGINGSTTNPGNVRLRLNDDAGNNYNIQRMFVEGNSITANTASASNIGVYLIYAMATSGGTGIGFGYVYAVNDGNKRQMISYGGCETKIMLSIGHWNNTTDKITKLTFCTDSGLIGAGTRIKVFRCKK
jgi:hypothetical protein